jgi:beta-glucosidase-like glycosyl hydrolase
MGVHLKNIVKRVQVSLESGCDMVLICNHPELVEQVIERDWPVSEKLQSIHCSSSLRKEILKNMHDSVISGHIGKKKTKEKLSHRYYWYEMREDISSLVWNCNNFYPLREIICNGQDVFVTSWCNRQRT